jgi:hypothetical protein
MFPGLDSLMSVHGIDEGDVETLESVYDILKKLCRRPSQESSVADPNPDPPDPHVFGPHGSGSISQSYGSGSGSGSFYL